MDARILSLEKQPRSKRIEVRFEDASVLSVTTEILVRFGLRSGSALSSGRLAELRREQEREDAMAAALRLVSYRPRSEKEMGDRLRQRGVDQLLVDATIARLKELRLLDDAAFASSWVESRDRMSPRSKRMLTMELSTKGIARDTANGASESVDEADAAYRAGLKRAQALSERPFEEFRRKVSDLLLRRGFSYEIAADVVKRLWTDATEETVGGVRSEP